MAAPRKKPKLLTDVPRGPFGAKLAERLQNFVRQVQRDTARSARAVEDRLFDVEADLALLALIQVAALRILCAKGVLMEDEFIPELDAVDLLDGVADGALHFDTFRELMGVPRPPREEPAAPNPVRASTAQANVRRLVSALEATARRENAKSAPGRKPVKAGIRRKRAKTAARRKSRKA